MVMRFNLKWPNTEVNGDNFSIVVSDEVPPGGKTLPLWRTLTTPSGRCQTKYEELSKLRFLGRAFEELHL